MNMKLNKKIIIVLPIIIVLIIIGIIVSNSNMLNIMGESVLNNNCDCNITDGWTLDKKNNTCYQETTENSIINAYLLGDIDDDGEVNSIDFEMLNDIVIKYRNHGSTSSNYLADLDERQETVYDINHDHQINNDDIVSFNEKMSSSSGNPVYFSEKVCPYKRTEESKDDNNTVTTETSYQYNKDDETCSVVKKIKTIKNDVCQKKSKISTSSNISNGVSNNYTITFDSNGGIGKMDNQIIALDEEQLLSKNLFSNNGHSFKGWKAYNESQKMWFCYIDEDHLNKNWETETACLKYGYYLFKDQEKVKNLAEANGLISLKAIWDNSYTISYNANGGTGIMEKQSMFRDIKTKISKNKFQRKNYKFDGWIGHDLNTDKWYCYDTTNKTKGWKTKQECNNKFYLFKDQEEVMNLADTDETVELQAKWINTYTLKYTSTKSTGKMDKQIISYGKKVNLFNNNYKKKNYQFIGWKAHNLDTNKWYCYTNKNLTKTSWLPANKCNHGYYLFKNKQSITDLAFISQTVNMIANWTNKYTIRYNNNGGSGKMNDQIITYGNNNQYLRNNTFKQKNNYFVGWKAHNKTTNQWNCYSNIKRTKHKWLPKSKCEKNGYYLYLNRAKVSKIAKPLEEVILIAKWSDYEYAESYNIIFPIKKYNIVGTKNGLSKYFSFNAGNVSQCPWYAKYRAIEIVMTSSLDDNEQKKAKEALEKTSGNGNKWYAKVNSNLKYFKYSGNVDKAKPGSIISWEMNSHSYGHVGIVEKVYSDGSILLSEGWNRFGANSSNGVSAIKIITRKMSKSNIKTYDGKGRFKGYTYLFNHQ